MECIGINRCLVKNSNNITACAKTFLEYLTLVPHSDLCCEVFIPYLNRAHYILKISNMANGLNKLSILTVITLTFTLSLVLFSLAPADTDTSTKQSSQPVGGEFVVKR